MFIFGKRSRSNLEGVHQDLIIVMTLALDRSEIDFGITEGLRTKKRQKELVESGASKTMNSRHLTGHAVDFACYIGGRVAWDWPLYDKVGKTVKGVAKDYGIHIVWGGDWTSFRDGPHVELSRRHYK